MHEPGEQSRHHGDVQTRDAHQVSDAGADIELPVGRLDRTLIAHGERHEYTAVTMVRQRLLELRANSLARALNEITRLHDEIVQPHALATRTYISGRTDIAF